jgi:hypothetical protein
MTGQPAVPRSGFLAALPPQLRTFVIVDAVLVLTFVVLFVMHLASSPSAPPVSAPVTTSTPTDEPETTPEPSSPADPAENEGLTEFVLPSGNIWCTMTETSATCTIGTFSYVPPADPECAGVIGPVLTLSEGEPASMPCVDAEPPRPEGAAVLEYGQASTIGDVTCHSSRNGATCRHNPSGAGFSVARAGYTFF